MKKIIAAVALAAVAGVAAWFFLPGKTPAPQVTFNLMNGQSVTTDDLRGKVTLVKFWATSCVTCVKQMPDNIDYYNTYHDKGFDMIAVAMRYDPPSYVENFIETRQLPFPVALDKNGELAEAFGDIRLTPIAFLIDRQGNIVKRYLGEYDKKEFLATLEKALAG